MFCVKHSLAMALIFLTAAANAQSCLHESKRPPEDVTQAIKRHMCAALAEIPADVDVCMHAHELDHIVPLCLCGAPLDPTNLQLQPWNEALAKDDAERGACRWYWGGERTDDRLQQARGVVVDWRNWQ